MKNKLIALAVVATVAVPLAISQNQIKEVHGVIDVKALEYRVQQLERKVAGMQKQITILHSKNKQLSDDLQAATISIEGRLDGRIDALEATKASGHNAK